MYTMKDDLTWHKTAISREQRHQLNQHKSCVVWLTGLSGSGKSTLANRLNLELHNIKVRSYVLDGDNLRHGLNADLDFSPAGRRENIRRVGEVAKLMVDSGLITITAFISPYREDRDRIRKFFAPSDFLEIYLNCPIATCIQRDPKGLYKKAAAGKIKNFTGISAPYEEPPELSARAQVRMVRFRTLGCYPLAGAIESGADTIEKIVAEMMTVNQSERTTRVIDFDEEGSMERKKRMGYF